MMHCCKTCLPFMYTDHPQGGPTSSIMLYVLDGEGFMHENVYMTNSATGPVYNHSEGGSVSDPKFWGVMPGQGPQVIDKNGIELALISELQGLGYLPSADPEDLIIQARVYERAMTMLPAETVDALRLRRPKGWKDHSEAIKRGRRDRSNVLAPDFKETLCSVNDVMRLLAGYRKHERFLHMWFDEDETTLSVDVGTTSMTFTAV